ncbi:MAG: class I SAM-dependent methyltransferase [Candidatus Paceibacterota bacterium]|jgi:2-polyprenyl-3-methyl-5-hydroxy-6-metoxy-1,4-benzoquinol methylase
MNGEKSIEFNASAHNKIFDRYERIHGEIFNPVEQSRLRRQLEQAASLIKSFSSVKKALDYGCGSGNLTKHLIDIGFRVSAADVSEKFLELVADRYGAEEGSLKKIKINGYDLSGIEDGSFDFFGSYSVLHHVPDYLKIVQEAARVIRRGGVIYFDHEANDAFWSKPKNYCEFLKMGKKMKWGKYLKVSNYINKIHRMIDKNYSPEGDIHVTSQDHIEWDKIEKILVENGCEILVRSDYLVYKTDYKMDIYESYKNKCSDMRVLIARKT